MKKLLNGKPVDMTPEEEAQRLADEAAEAKKPPLPHPVERDYARNPAYAALVDELAARFGETPQQVVESLKARKPVQGRE